MFEDHIPGSAVLHFDTEVVPVISFYQKLLGINQ